MKPEIKFVLKERQWEALPVPYVGDGIRWVAAVRTLVGANKKGWLYYSSVDADYNVTPLYFKNRKDAKRFADALNDAE